MSEPSIAELERDADDRRKAYLAGIENAPRLTAQENNQLGHTPTSLAPLTALLERWLAAQKDGVAYEVALSRLQARRAEEAQARNEALQRTMTWATVAIAVFTVVSVLVPLAGLFCRQH
jgi:hypothetical protein